MDIDLTDALIKSVNSTHRENKIGRYHISKIWGMLNGYLPPEKYLEGEQLDFTGAINVWQGTNKHNQIQDLLRRKYGSAEMEVKKELKVGDFTIVGSCDVLFPGELWELKTSMSLIPAKKWAIHQLKLYLHTHDREEGAIYQPRMTGTKLFLKELGRYKKSQKWFDGEMEKLQRYHNQLLKL